MDYIFMKRNMLLILSFLAIWTLLLAGCSDLPPQVGHQVKNQEKIASIQHWQVLAQDVAEEIVSAVSGKSDETVLLYVKPLPGVFGSAFAKMINAELLRAGKSKSDQRIQVLTKQQDNSLTVNISAMVVRHREGERIRPYPGTFTLLAGGIAVMRDLAWNEILLVAGGLTDLFRASQDISIPDSELLVTTSIEQNGIFLFLQNNLYYLNSSDIPLYTPPVHREAKSYSLQAE